MQSTQARTCTIEGCRELRHGRGLCNTHYRRLRRTGTTDAPSRAVCSIDGCVGGVADRGLCRDHIEARRSLRASRGCSVDGCDERHKARGLCLRHYQLQWATENRHKTRAATRAAKLKRPDYYREQNALWRVENAERMQASRKAWATANREAVRQNVLRRRARLRDTQVFLITARDIERLLRRHHGRCAYCRTPLRDGFHLDHIVPLARGGHHAIGNLAPACPECNCSKGVKFLSEWRKRRPLT